jgi:hypothetical protein
VTPPLCRLEEPSPAAEEPDADGACKLWKTGISMTAPALASRELWKSSTSKDLAS